MWQEEADLLQTCTLPLTVITMPGSEGVLLWEIKFKKAVIPSYSWQLRKKKTQSFLFNKEESMIQAVFRMCICHVNAEIGHMSVMYWISTRRTGNASFPLSPQSTHRPETALQGSSTSQIFMLIFQMKECRKLQCVPTLQQWFLSGTCLSPKSCIHHLPKFLSPIWRTADTRRQIILQYFSPFLNLNDWLSYILFQDNPCWIRHYSVCLRCLYNWNLGFGPLCIWASTTVVGSVGRCRTKRDWYLRV